MMLPAGTSDVLMYFLSVYLNCWGNDCSLPHRNPLVSRAHTFAIAILSSFHVHEFQLNFHSSGLWIDYFFIFCFVLTLLATFPIHPRIAAAINPSRFANHNFCLNN
jgi:hypothetical protein